MKRQQDYRETTGTEVLPEFTLRYYLIDNFTELMTIQSRMVEESNLSRRKKEFTRKVAEIRPLIITYLNNDEKKGKHKEIVEKCQQAFKNIKEKNGNLNSQDAEDFTSALSDYYYCKGFTALDAKNEEDPARSLL